MIHRDTKNGQKLDVAGLNEITVLIDRSETALTEVAMNSWSPGLDGPPHAHDRKEQNFLVTAGRGHVTIGGERFSAAPGDFFYVPAGVVHQTINKDPVARLDYFLFNAFLDTDKEGHASFAAHIDLVKETRRKQADTQQSGVAVAPATAPTGARHAIRVATSTLEATATILLGRDQTERCEAVHHRLSAGQRLSPPADAAKEQTFYILAGSGRFRVGGEEAEATPGQVVFVPHAGEHAIEAGADGLTAVSFGTIVSR